MNHKRAFTLLELLILIGIIGILAAILVPNFIRARSRGQITACKSNLKNLATALEMYSTDYSGNFPTQLEPLLTPNYLRTIPTCPAAGRAVYIQGYHSWNPPAPPAGEERVIPSTYMLWCEGLNHKSVDIRTPGYPQYHSATGLIERP